MAGVSAPLRHRAPLPVPQAIPGLDPPSSAWPEQAERWSWLVAVAYVHLVLARGLIADQRLSWERRRGPLSPLRVKRGFRGLHRAWDLRRNRENLHGPVRAARQGVHPSPRRGIASSVQ
ncbi:hypothetical protein [Kibdelosporangium philippinense]|uniref:hypothetical protein n=1 Tax=Kibdelosporangium philippinense TaxID=211113 RepID=UPI003616B69A